MKVLVLGGNGMLGPWTIKALESRHDLRVTDINDKPQDFTHEYIQLDASDHDGVVDAATGMDVIVNLSVLRQDRKLAFDVSTRGNYNMMVAARKHGIGRVVNTGPHFQTVGPQYEEWDFGLNPDVPPAAWHASLRADQVIGPGNHPNFFRAARHPGAHAPLLQHDASRTPMRPSQVTRCPCTMT